jgi:hypothetical protein
MYYPQEFCPNCQEMRDMDISLSLRPAQREEEEVEILTIDYRCISCHRLVYQSPFCGDPQEEVMRPSALYV